MNTTANRFTATRSLSQCSGGSERRRAFTLNELLVVMAIIVIVLALAVPAFNAITNSRSVEAAENQISSYLAVVRSEAVGLQQPRGAILFVDAGSDRLTIAQIYFPATSALPHPIIELFPGRDEAVMPKGVGLRAIPNGSAAATSTMNNWPRYAVIMFDGEGRLMPEQFRLANATNLATRVNTPPGGTNPDRVPVSTLLSADPLRVTHIGFQLFDKSAHAEQPAANANTWLQDNAFPYIVNRYNGTLLKGR